jgi:Asp-tRNA(Asn)/Glu-tRNA(Gln) amidotransferase A subunit family amidase
VRTKLERCRAVGDAEVEAGRRELTEYRERAAEALDGVDLLLVPTTAFTAPPADADELAFRERGIRFTYPFDALGWPALALPCGRTEDGLHVSIQLVGAPGGDARVLAAGALLASLV